MRINQKVVIGLSRVGQTLINQTEGCNEQFPGFCRISGGIATWHSFESYTWNLLSLTRIQSNVVCSGCIWPGGKVGTMSVPALSSHCTTWCHHPPDSLLAGRPATVCTVWKPELDWGLRVSPSLTTHTGLCSAPRLLVDRRRTPLTPLTGRLSISPRCHNTHSARLEDRQPPLLTGGLSRSSRAQRQQVLVFC